MLRMRTFLLLALAATLLSGAASADTKLLARIAPMQPPGWDSPLVPRVSAGSLATDALTTAPGLAPTSPVWINWAVSTNAAVNGTWVDQLELDGVPVQLLPRRKQAFAAQNWFAMDAGPLYVRGGRHTVEAQADVANRLEDYNFQYDNEAYRQLLWTPEPLTAAPGVTFSLDAPPQPFPPGAAVANNHAYSLAAPTHAWAVATAGALDLDLTLFDDFTNSTTGLSHALATSARTLDSADVVVSGGGGLPASVYPAVTRKPGAGESSYFVDWMDTNGHLDTDGDAFWGAESLLYGRIVNLYAIDLQAGIAYPMSAWTREGTRPVHFAVFPADPTFVGSLAQALVRSQPVAGQDYEVATFTPSTAGRYLILAFRDQNSDTPTRYQLAVGSQAAGVGAGQQSGVQLGVAPNPSRDEARVTFALPTAAHARLEILDVQGRTVRTVFDGPRAAGPQSASWDLRDGAGAIVAPGLYWARLDVGGERRLTRLSVLR